MNYKSLGHFTALILLIEAVQRKPLPTQAGKRRHDGRFRRADDAVRRADVS